MQNGHSSKQAVVVHSGGMDSSICLALALQCYGADNVVSLSFSYGQRHSTELGCAEKICRCWGVDHVVHEIGVLAGLTANALICSDLPIEHPEGEPPNTLVLGRNGLMARLAAIYAHSRGASCIYMGVMEAEGANSGYRDCSRAYMDLKQQILRIDLGDEAFEIRTPLVSMDKCSSLELAQQLGVLEFLWDNTVSCYQGIAREGCRHCPACLLRNEGLARYNRILNLYPASCNPVILFPHKITG